MSKNDRDEVIISALITAPTIRAAAETVGMSESQLYARLKEQAFREQYTAAKVAILKAAEAEAISKLSDSIQALWDMANTPYQKPTIRMKAYELIINSALRISESAHKAERDAISDTAEDNERAFHDQLFSFDV